MGDTMEKYLTLFDYQCKVCHWTYFSTYDDDNCPQCDTENTPLRVGMYQKLKEESYETNKMRKSYLLLQLSDMQTDSFQQ